ncbi:MAG: hypothetical protein ACYC37_03505 [Desulfobacteria bacterium]
MKGRVVAVNQRKGMILVETTDGECSLVELLGGYDVNTGDVIEGDLESLGGEMLRNVTSKEKMSVFVQDIHMSKTYGMKVIGKA